MQYLIAYDFGTTGVKTCLFGAEQDIRLIASAYAGYGLYILPDGGAEHFAKTVRAIRALCPGTTVET